MPNRYQRWYVRLANGITAVRYSLPLQLLLSQVRQHKVLVIFWLFLFGVLFQQLLKGVGAPYILLEPEYRDERSPLSLLWMGMALGLFTVVYQMALYILDGFQFYFLTLVRYPFLKFCLNNSPLPLSFWLAYGLAYYNFQMQAPDAQSWAVLRELLAFYLGGVGVAALFFGYFSWANRSALQYVGTKLARDLNAPRVVLRRAKDALSRETRVDNFLNGWRFRRVTEFDTPVREVTKALDQNHRNALLAMLVVVLVLMLLGLLQDDERFQIPAGASYLVLFSAIIMLIGAVSFWFRRLGVLWLVLVLAGWYLLNQFVPAQISHYAYGMDYTQDSVSYNHRAVRAHITPKLLYQDSVATIQTLNRWRRRLGRVCPEYSRRKPPLVLLCVSGGGTRSALFTVRALQKLDSLTHGRFWEQTRLITGASGGMLGAAYYRELKLLAQQDPGIDPQDPVHADRISRDLLSPIVYSLAVNTFVPGQQWSSGQFAYPKDRGYAFELKLARNLDSLLANKRLGDYRQPTAQARTPQVVLTPVVVNDGRKLFISSMGVSYLAQADSFGPRYRNQNPGVEFRRFFPNHLPDSLHYTTALRMSASFPTILPYVQLPTAPLTEVVDAGTVDNYGVETAVRFLYTFREWITRNTSGVTLVQIRDSPQQEAIRGQSPSALSRALFSVGAPINAMARAQDFQNDELLHYAQGWLQAPLRVVELQYIPKDEFQRASLSFRLTQQEKQDVLNALNKDENQKAFRFLQQQCNAP